MITEDKSRSFDGNGERPIPLTRAQKLIWLGQRLNPSTPLYNMAMTFRYRFQLDEQRFRAAFDRVVMGEETLRLAICGDGEDVSLCATKGRSPALSRLDLAHDEVLEDVMKDWVQRPFRENEPLTRSVLIKHDDSDWTWLLVQHHLVTDVATFFLLHQRLSALYDGDEAVGEDAEPREDWPSFRSYEELESQRGKTEAMRQARRSTRDRVRHYAGSVSYERIGDVPSWRSERSRSPLPSALRQGETFGDGLGGTMWSLAVFFTVLHRLGGVAQPVIGVPLHNRTSPKRRNTAGMLVEVVPLSVEVSDDDSLADVHQRVVTEFAELVKSGTVGLADAVAIGSVDFVLNVINAPDLSLDEHPVEPVWHHCDAIDPGHALRVHIWRDESGEGGQLLFDVRTDTFSEPRREDFVAMFLHLLEQAAVDRYQRVGDVPLLPTRELKRQMLRAQGPRVPCDFNGGIAERFRVGANRHGDATALTQGSHQMTYAELDEASDQVAAALQQADIGVGDRVAIWRPRSIEAVVDILGIMKTGAAFSVLDTALPTSRIQTLIGELGGDRSVLVLTESDRRDEVIAMGGVLAPMEVHERYEPVTVGPDECCYVLFTSGSTGTPKGVMVSHGAITDYIDWAGRVYDIDATVRFGLFTSLAFDLTLTSLFLPLVHGGTLRVYPAGDSADVAVTDAVAENGISFAKITPSHLAFWSDEDLRRTAITRWVIGGEDLKTTQARRIVQSDRPVRIFNEYGPTEATVACMIHEFDPHADSNASVPIGVAADNHDIYLLDEQQRPVPDELIGEIYIGGAGVAKGYLNRPADTERRFIASPFGEGILYRTGDLGRWDRHDHLHYLGRTDRQVKVSGVRLELGEIENILLGYPGVTQAVTDTLGTEQLVARGGERFCEACGLSEKYPSADIDASGICAICQRFRQQKERVMEWFGTGEEFADIAARMKSEATGDHDCIVLFSGGKDSTYMLYQLVKFGLRPVALTLENGYLSKQAKDNISRAVQDLGVDHEYLGTPYMDQIFADSLKTFNNVCNGCFKTIYTLSTRYALERNIGYVVTGLSRGQLFETRLDDLFDRDDVPIDAYDELIASARKVYHRQDDLISKCLDGAIFQDDATFDKVQFVDFYRYIDVPLSEVYAFLESRAPWVRPTDTGRSTNCLINDTGIFVHTRQTGYHNYALPYSWDVRLGHKTRDEALEELNDHIDADSVKQNLQQIGYDRALFGLSHLAAWVVGEGIDVERLKHWLKDQLPAYALPDVINPVDQLPLTPNGKVDLDQLKKSVVSDSDTDGAPCRPGTERLLADAWLEVLGHAAAVYRNSHFFSLGGDSMAAILLVSELRKRDLLISLDQVFDSPVLSDMATRVVPVDSEAIEGNPDEDPEDDLGLALGEGEIEQLAEKLRPPTP